MKLSEYFKTIADAIRSQNITSDLIRALSLPSSISGLLIAGKVKSASGSGAAESRDYSGETRNSASISFRVSEAHSVGNGAIELKIECFFHDSGGASEHEFKYVTIG